ncbi:peroxiredoxin [Flavobacterium sp. Root186]|uniref:peroxiredoxin n=1 Tax=Flavobacterium sp. Root186 TaxID=1736485 RepID=UPI0009E87986|nr:peroxiredoxin [Flavobacterium sp. Root186]
MITSKKLKGIVMMIIAILSLTVSNIYAQETLKKGDKAPVFTLKNQDGKDFKLADHLGKQNIVVFFYPMDQSPVCTAEVCAFRDAYAKYKDANALVIGINQGTVESHKAFQSKEKLPFDLLSDPDNKVLKLFGVKEENLGTMILSGRETFVIGKDGVIAYSFRDFMKGEDHSKEVLSYLKK